MGRGTGQAVTFEDLDWYIQNGVFESTGESFSPDKRLAKKLAVEQLIKIKTMTGDAGRAVKSNELIADVPISCGTNVVCRWPDTPEAERQFEYVLADGAYGVYKKTFTIDIVGGSGTINISYTADNGVGWEEKKQIYVTDGVNYYQSPVMDTSGAAVSGSGSFEYNSANGSQVEVTLYIWIADVYDNYLTLSWGDFTVDCPVSSIQEYNILLYPSGTDIMYEVTKEDGGFVTLPTPIVIDLTVFTILGSEPVSTYVSAGSSSGLFWSQVEGETIDSFIIESWTPTDIQGIPVNVSNDY